MTRLALLLTLAALPACTGEEPTDATDDTDIVEGPCPGGTDLLTWYADADADGFGDPEDATEACEQPVDYTAEAGDCDDADPAINPGAPERCNDGVDDDCDPGTDEVGGSFVDGALAEDVTAAAEAAGPEITLGTCGGTYTSAWTLPGSVTAVTLRPEPGSPRPLLSSGRSFDWLAFEGDAPALTIRDIELATGMIRNEDTPSASLVIEGLLLSDTDPDGVLSGVRWAAEDVQVRDVTGSGLLAVTGTTVDVRDVSLRGGVDLQGNSLLVDSLDLVADGGTAAFGGDPLALTDVTVEDTTTALTGSGTWTRGLLRNGQLLATLDGDITLSDVFLLDNPVPTHSVIAGPAASEVTLTGLQVRGEGAGRVNTRMNLEQTLRLRNASITGLETGVVCRSVGGALVLDGGQIRSSGSTDRGGALDVEGCALTVSDTQIIRNLAPEGSAVVVSDGPLTLDAVELGTGDNENAPADVQIGEGLPWDGTGRVSVTCTESGGCVE